MRKLQSSVRTTAARRPSVRRSAKLLASFAVLATTPALLLGPAAQATPMGAADHAAQSTTSPDTVLGGSWALFNDFKLAPNQANPSADQYGNPGVWTYLTGVPGSGSYTPLTIFNAAAGGHTGLETWNDGFYTDLPSVAVNASGAAIHIPSGGRMITYPKNKAIMHPYDSTHASIAQWHSPITGSVKVKTQLSLAETPNCGNGVQWSLWKNATQLGTGVITLTSPLNMTTVVPVSTADSLYLAIDSIAGSYVCDSTLTTLSLKQM